MPVLPPPPKHLAGSHGSQSSSPSHPPLNKASAALSFLDDELLSLGRRAPPTFTNTSNMDTAALWQWDICVFDGDDCSQLLSGLNDPPGTLNSQPKPKLNELSDQWTSLQVHVIWFVSQMLCWWKSNSCELIIFFCPRIAADSRFRGRYLWKYSCFCAHSWPTPHCCSYFTESARSDGLFRSQQVLWHLQGASTCTGSTTLCCYCWSIVWNFFPVCLVGWRLVGAPLWFLQQCQLLCPGIAVPPHPLSSSIQCPALPRCPRPRPGTSAQPRAARCFTSSPPVILRFTAARDELRTCPWAMCTCPWKPSDPVRMGEFAWLVPKIRK